MSHERHIGHNEMQGLLREAYAGDSEKSFLRQLTRSLSDPATAGDAESRPRPHPLWLPLGMIAAFVVIVFLSFSFLRP